jgi:hypothetical protein
MSSYTEARHQNIGGGLYCIVSDPPGMWFYVGNPSTGLGVLIPDGFITDGPSFPYWLRILLHLVGLRTWVTDCLLKASAIHDRMREDRQFSLIESDCYFLIALKADQKNWLGPGWACDLLRELAFLGVRTNRGRLVRNPSLAQSATS